MLDASSVPSSLTEDTPLNITRVQIRADCMVEGWGEEKDEPVFTAHEVSLDRCHGACATRKVIAIAQSSPIVNDCMRW